MPEALSYKSQVVVVTGGGGGIGVCFELGGGYIHKIRTQLSKGTYIPEADYSAETMRQKHDS